MQVRVVIEGTSRQIDVARRTDGRWAVSVDGEAVDAEIHEVHGGVCVSIGGRTWDVAVGGGGEERTVAAGAARSLATVETERARAKAKKRGGAGGAASKSLVSPMPGRIVKVLCAAGDEVAAGAPLVVIEAMKMENELRAAGPVKVASVQVTPGQSVEGGAVLVTFA
jgi:biotin carboxyl carrier protein